MVEGEIFPYTIMTFISTPPDVPKAFIWKDPVSGESIRAFYLNGGYGGLNHILPGYPFDWTGVPGSTDIMARNQKGLI